MLRPLVGSWPPGHIQYSASLALLLVTLRVCLSSAGTRAVVCLRSTCCSSASRCVPTQRGWVQLLPPRRTREKTRTNILFSSRLIWDNPTGQTVYFQRLGTHLMPQKAFQCEFKCRSVWKFCFPSKTTPSFTLFFPSLCHNFSITTFLLVNFSVSLGRHLYCMVDVLFLWSIDKLMDGLLESLDAWRSSSDANWDNIIDKLPNFHISIHFLRTVPLRLEPLPPGLCLLLEVFYHFTAALQYSFQVMSGVRADIWVFEKSSLSVSVCLLCTEKFQGFA